MDRGTGDGSINDLPWASVFDPAANARALSAIQAEGFRAASEIVDRFARIATTGLNGKDRSTTSAAPLTNDQRADLFGATDIDPLLRSWWVMIGQFLLGLCSPRSRSGFGGRGQPRFSNGEAEGRLDLGPRRRVPRRPRYGCTTGAQTDLGQIRLRCSDLLAHDGSVISSDAVRVESRHRSDARPVEPWNRRENRGAARCSTRHLPRHLAGRGPRQNSGCLWC